MSRDEWGKFESGGEGEGGGGGRGGFAFMECGIRGGLGGYGKRRMVRGRSCMICWKTAKYGTYSGKPKYECRVWKSIVCSDG